MAITIDGNGSLTESHHSKEHFLGDYPSTTASPLSQPQPHPAVTTASSASVCPGVGRRRSVASAAAAAAAVDADSTQSLGLGPGPGPGARRLSVPMRVWRAIREYQWAQVRHTGVVFALTIALCVPMLAVQTALKNMGDYFEKAPRADLDPLNRTLPDVLLNLWQPHAVRSPPPPPGPPRPSQRRPARPRQAMRNETRIE